MSEVGPTVAHAAAIGSSFIGINLPQLYDWSSKGYPWFGMAIGVPSIEHQSFFEVMENFVVAETLVQQAAFGAIGLSFSVNHTASVLYSFEVAAAAYSVPAHYAHIAQRYGGVSIVELRAYGKLADVAFFEGLVGQPLDIKARAVDLFGKVLSSNILFTAVITNAVWSDDHYVITASASFELLTADTISVETILFLGMRSDGRRNIRIPVQWGITAGASVSNDLLSSNILIDYYSLTLTRQYGVIDLTERLEV